MDRNENAKPPTSADSGEDRESESRSFAKWETCERIMARDYDLFRRLAKF